MPIDPRIALGVQQSTFDPAAAMQNALAIRNARLQEQANQLKIQQEQQAMQEAAGLQNYLASADLSKPEGLSGLYRYGTAGAATAKSIAERQAAEALTTERGASAKKTLGEYSLKKVDAYKDMLNFVRNPQEYAKWVQMQRNDPDLAGTPVHDISDEDLQRNLAMIPTDQAGFDAFKGKAWMGIDKWTTSQQQAATAAETKRSDLESERLARERLEFDKAREKRLASEAEAKLSEPQKAGKDSLTQNIIDLRNAYTTLVKGSDIVDVNAPAWKNIVTSVQSSGIGQKIGGMVGTEAQSARNTISNSRPLLLNAIKQATGMSSKQLDSNKDIQMWLNAATNPQQDIQSNIRALKKLDTEYNLNIDFSELENLVTKSAPAAGATQKGATTSNW